MASLAEIRQQYPQYQDMSDADLASALHRKFYSDMPRADFDQKLGLAATPQQVDPAMDVVKSGAANLGRGVIDMLGVPGNIGGWVARGAEAAGVPEDYRKAFGQMAAATPMLRSFTGPTSDDIQSKVEKYTGPFYEAQTALGKYVGSVARMAPAAVLPGSLAAKTANVVLPGVASEAAGQAVQGTQYESYEPYARAAAGLAGGAAASRVGRVNASTTQRAAGSVDDRIAEVQEAATRGYQSPAIAAVEFRPGVVDALVNTSLRQLDRARFNDRLAPQTRGILEDLRTPMGRPGWSGPGFHTIEDLQTARQQLSTVAGNFANPTEQAAASRAIENITSYLTRMPQHHLSRGNAAEAGQAWNNARANHAAAKTAQKVQDKLYAAEGQAASANSGANAGNASRQKLRTLLTNPKQGRGLTEAEGELIEQAVQGSRLANALRTGGNLLGGGGGLGALVTGGAGALAAGLPGLALPVVGKALKSAGDAVTRSQANRIVDAILERAPETAAIQQRGQNVLSARKRQALAAQLSLAPLSIIK